MVGAVQLRLKLPVADAGGGRTGDEVVADAELLLERELCAELLVEEVAPLPPPPQPDRTSAAANSSHAGCLYLGEKGRMPRC